MNVQWLCQMVVISVLAVEFGRFDPQGLAQKIVMWGSSLAMHTMKIKSCNKISFATRQTDEWNVRVALVPLICICKLFTDNQLNDRRFPINIHFMFIEKNTVVCYPSLQ